MTKTLLYSVFAAGVVLGPVQAIAQVPPTPAPAAAAPAPAEPLAPVIAVVGEEYRVELQGGAWASMPTTAMYSDTESITTSPNGVAVTTVVTGTNLDFKSALGLKNQVFAEGHLTIRLAPKHKLRGEYIPVFYKQATTLGADFKFNGQTYLAGQTVESTLRMNEWNVAYEFDPIVVDRGYIGGLVAVTSLNLSGATANTAQSGTAGVNIIMPGLGATGRYYVSGKVSVTGDFLFFDLPGSSTSTHGHVVNAGGYLTYNINKHAGAQFGYRFLSSSHMWDSPANSGSMTIPGPFVGGTAHF